MAGSDTVPASDLRSRLTGPMADLAPLKRALLLAEVSMVSYLDDATDAAATLGFTETRFIDRDGAQAYVFETTHDRVIACRGTEPNEWNDIKADANALRDAAETVGRVHRGFKREVDDLWPLIKEELVDDGRDLWSTGHSLGGAMATICAGRCKLDEIPVSPVETQTFGSPRVGSKRYVTHSGIEHLRWVNNNDVVTRVPPRWLGYVHTGTKMYLDSNGDHLPKFTAAQVAKDRAKGFRNGLKQRKLDHFADHAIAAYVEYIARAAED